jgi:hypothetical protein
MRIGKESEGLQHNEIQFRIGADRPTFADPELLAND